MKRCSQICIFSLSPHSLNRRVNFVTPFHGGLVSQLEKPSLQPPVVVDDLNHAGQVVQNRVRIDLHTLKAANNYKMA